MYCSKKLEFGFFFSYRICGLHLKFKDISLFGQYNRPFFYEIAFECEVIFCWIVYFLGVEDVYDKVQVYVKMRI